MARTGHYGSDLDSTGAHEQTRPDPPTMSSPSPDHVSTHNPRPVGDDDGPTGDRWDLLVLQRCAWTLVWFSVLTLGLGFWETWSGWPGAAVLSPCLVLLGILGAAAQWLVARPDRGRWPWIGLTGALVAYVGTSAAEIHARHKYATDAAAFNQAAAKVLTQGHDPYNSIWPLAGQFLAHPLSQRWTYTISGGHVTGFSYPSGSFVLQAPFELLGFNHLVTDWIDLLAWAATGVIMFLVLPRSLRWLAPFVLLLGIFATGFANGGTDALFMPFLVLALWRWDRAPRFDEGPTSWLPVWFSPACFGLACSIKQLPWFCLPFLLAGVFLEAQRAGRSPARAMVRYGAVVAGVFLAFNLPFILVNPATWLSGTLLPFTEPLVADGQGLVTLALHGATGGVVLTDLSLAGLLVLVALMALVVSRWSRFRRAWLFLVPLVLFIPGRSLANYLVDLFPAALVAALTITSRSGVQEETGTRAPSARWRRSGLVVAWASAAVAMGLVVTGFTSAPLTLKVDQVGVADPHAPGSTFFTDLVVTVHNTTGHDLTPHFMVDIGHDHPVGFWRVTAHDGSWPVAAGGTTTLFLRPEVPTATPVNGQYWLLDAYSSGPAALSTSPLAQWHLGNPNGS